MAMELTDAINHLKESLADPTHKWGCEECKQEHEQLLVWLEDYKRLLSESSWIPVDDRMPDKNSNEHQIVHTKGKMTGITSYGKYDSTDGKWVILGSEVTHWMLMPEPPKEVQHGIS
jgi:hypothetical protein